MVKSYNQKAQAYFNIIFANPKASANEIGRRYAGTELGMRKQDRNDLVKAIKEQLNQRESFIEKMTNSNMNPKRLRSFRRKVSVWLITMRKSRLGKLNLSLKKVK